jgi:uncharacterized protein YcbK (DUF882 family)
MGLRVPASSASEFSTPIFPSGIGQCAGLVALITLLGSSGLENAVANGDTRTLSLHHVHTEEDITVTYKRDGRYDEEALKRLDHFLRDWRKDEDIQMDPRLFDVIWEVSREIGGDKVIDVVCGYRSPSTNAMLRRRSSGVAEFSQHMLGKAMDFYVPGAPLEQLRDAGLRLQRGGVGYYPSSGSPFVHLDVGSVRHWPPMTHDQLARVFPNGRTVHVPSDGHPLPGYALALADIERRGSSPPSQSSLNAAQAAGIDVASAGVVHKKNLLAALFHLDEDEDDAAQVAPAAQVVPATQAAPATSASRSFSLASIDSKADTARSSFVPVPAARPQRTALAVVAQGANNDTASARDEQARWATTVPVEPQRLAAAHAVPRVPLSRPDSAPALTPWPIREVETDRVPPDVALAYAARLQGDGSADLGREATEEKPIRVAGPTRAVVLRDSDAAAGKKGSPHAYLSPQPLASREVLARVKVVARTASPGMHYDDPWLRAIIVAPRLYGSMTATLYGQPDFTALRMLMNKPTIAVVMSFADEPYPGITTTGFSGEAVVPLTTYAFSRTASLQ